MTQDLNLPELRQRIEANREFGHASFVIENVELSALLDRLERTERELKAARTLSDEHFATILNLQSSPAGAAVLDDVRETLLAVRHYVEGLSEESSYGYSRPANPHDFHPDAECCTDEEIAAHKAACEAYDKGEYTPEKGSEWVGNMHILHAPWGIGSYTYRDEHASKLLAGIDAILAAPPAPSVQQQVPEAVMRALCEARDEAMKYTLAARIPECGNFGSIAQNLDWAITELAAPSAPAVQPLKDHVIRDTVNQLTQIARDFHAAGQLRERIANVLVPLLKVTPAPEYDWCPECHLRESTAEPAPVAQASQQPELDLLDIVRSFCSMAQRLTELTPQQRELYPSPLSPMSPLFQAASAACVERGYTEWGLAVEGVEYPVAAPLQQAEGWIPLSERKPANCEIVIVALDNGTVTTGNRIQGSWDWIGVKDGDCYATATHWKPLPPSPAQSQPAGPAKEDAK